MWIGRAALKGSHLNYPSLNKSSKLTACAQLPVEQVDRLMVAVLPDQAQDLRNQRKRLNQMLLKCVKTRHWSKFCVTHAAFAHRQLALDEGSLALLIMGLSSFGRLDLARQVFSQACLQNAEMPAHQQVMHPFYLNYLGGALDQLEVLQQVDSSPRAPLLQRLTAMSFEVGQAFKKRRIMSVDSVVRQALVAVGPNFYQEAPHMSASMNEGSASEDADALEVLTFAESDV